MTNVQLASVALDPALGVAWWNSITDDERRMWLAFADSAVPYDAWCAYLRDKDS